MNVVDITHVQTLSKKVNILKATTIFLRFP